MPEGSRPPRLFRVYAAVLFSAGFIMLAWSWRIAPPHASIQLVLLAVAAVLSENYSLALPNSGTVSLAYPLTIAAIVLGGPTVGAITAALTAVSLNELRRHTPASVVAFNFGQLLVVPLLGGWVYLALGGRLLLGSTASGAGPLVAADFPQLLVPLAALALVCAFGNVILAATGTAVVHQLPPATAFLSMSWMIPSQIALSLVGYLIAEVLATSLFAFPLFVAPLLVARQLYQHYTELKAAYADTVRSLIGAMEAKDPYTRGHSERVAEYAVQLGSHLELESRTLERLEYAALLHDLGKLAVPGAILSKPAALTEQEFDTVRFHPARGAEMVSKIPPLKDLAEWVRMHHEWYGGGGYPTGVSSPEIPRAALILTVVDCYDAMTTTRSYRPALSREEAVAELVRGAGSQFDPDLVRAFIESRVGASVPSAGSQEDDSRLYGLASSERVT